MRVFDASISLQNIQDDKLGIVRIEFRCRQIGLSMKKEGGKQR